MSDIITVVTGLSRSGTSMMMKLLADCGIEPYTDNCRPPDKYNPQGYFQHLNADLLHVDASWVPEVRGKAVKIFVQLLKWLPITEQYHIILMDRNIEDIISSQRQIFRLDDTNNNIALVYKQQIERAKDYISRCPNMKLSIVRLGK